MMHLDSNSHKLLGPRPYLFLGLIFIKGFCFCFLVLLYVC